MAFLTRITRRVAVFWAVFALLFSASTFATEVAGVKVDDTAQVGNQLLKLNGAGIRYKVIFKVYVAALYLAETKATPAEVMALPGAKRVSLIMLRDVSSEDFGQKFMDGIRKNAEMSERAKLVNAMLTFGQMFASVPELKKGDMLNVDWVPGAGVVSQLNGKKIGETVADPNFYNALLRIWLGNSPADEKLKHKMLNDKSE
jgi:hypothetical protein